MFSLDMLNEEMMNILKSYPWKGTFVYSGHFELRLYGLLWSFSLVLAHLCG